MELPDSAVQVVGGLLAVVLGVLYARIEKRKKQIGELELRVSLLEQRLSGRD